MADPKEMAERLRGLGEALTSGSVQNNPLLGALVCEKAATLIERLTVEGLAGVAGKAITVWTTGDVPEDDLRTTIAQAILDHLTTGTEVQG